MKSSSVIRNAIAPYRENELIMASRLYKESLNGYVSEAAYYKMLERMCKSGELAKATKGIYYIPTIDKYGVVPLSENQIVEAFTQNETGVVIGYAMYNRLNLTTQVSKNINIFSSALEGLSKTVRNVLIKKAQLEYSEPIKKMICGLEVLQNFYEIEDLNYSAFLEYTKSIALNYNNEIFKTVISKISYKKSTISFLREILEYYHVPNDLGMNLSSLSSYKHPHMEELYELAQASR